MNKICFKYQEDLIDISYNEKIMDTAIKEHLENCESCREYWKELNEIKVELDNFEEKIPIDYNQISQAFDIVEERRVKKTNIFSLLAFVLLSSLLLGTVLGLVIKGYGKEVIYFQIITYIIIPFLLPILIKIRNLKEGYNE